MNSDWFKIQHLLCNFQALNLLEMNNILNQDVVTIIYFSIGYFCQQKSEAKPN